MADTPEAIAKSIKKYLFIGVVLLVFTAITVALSYVDFGSHSRNMTIGLAVATFKTTLVVGYFMHMFGEKKLIYKVVLFSVVFLGVMFILFVNAHNDPLANHDSNAIFGVKDPHAASLHY